MSDLSHPGAPKWLHLSTEEQVLWFGRPHWITILPTILLMVIMFAIAITGTVFLDRMDVGATVGSDFPGWISLLPLVIALIGLFGGVWVFLKWRYTAYVITSGEIYEKRGIISQNIDHFRIERIQNTTCDQSIIERLLSFGNVVIYTAGSGKQDMILDNVPNPKQVDRTLAVQYDELQKKTDQKSQTAK
ncbi:PH domain-containing protein (plasmid) [Halococcus dombrowskii]|uniref:PH domain-containing protein n=1 Tax=Halococcus dombrowskii TaxID=179637 RepID=A0AAV3SM53_HALDO|nr:PH domain-containing protein [Halococcus dombrowskii]UOO96749.1 PH domain-containing protein [Halococcus dombrowskii]